MERKDILNVLQKAKADYIELEIASGPNGCGMCYYIDCHIMLTNLFVSSDYTYIKNIIPEFNREFLNSDSTNIYWWPVDDIESRIKAFDKLITIYEKDNNIC